MKYTKIPQNTFKEIVVNQGVLLTEFTPATATVTDTAILGAVGTDGVTFTATPNWVDFGEDIGNCPKNMMELKRLESWDVKMSGTFKSVNSTNLKSLIAACDEASGKFTPRNDIDTADFQDIWLVADYSDKNGETNGGYFAIHLLNALNTGGLSVKVSDSSKGEFAFSYTGHYSMDAQDTVPFEVYMKAGTEET
jgi:hypothetical protein